LTIVWFVLVRFHRGIGGSLVVWLILALIFSLLGGLVGALSGMGRSLDRAPRVGSALAGAKYWRKQHDQHQQTDQCGINGLQFNNDSPIRCIETLPKLAALALPRPLSVERGFHRGLFHLQTDSAPRFPHSFEGDFHVPVTSQARELLPPLYQ